MATSDNECTACRTVKPESDFSGHSRRCNKCRYQKKSERANASLEGFLQMRLTSMKSRQREKNYSGTTIGLIDLMRLYESDLSVSPDRIDNTLGYIDGNVRLVCSRANLMMSNMDASHFEWWCRAVVNNARN
jgi:hypothetical protein